MVVTSRTITNLNRGSSNDTTSTNTTATTSTSASTATTTSSPANHNTEAFNGETAEYDSILAESIIRMRSQLHRETAGSSVNASHHSTDSFISSELTPSTTAPVPQPMISTSTGSAATSASSVKKDAEYASLDSGADGITEVKKQALSLSEASQPQNQDVSITPELTSLIDIVNKKRAAKAITSHDESMEQEGTAPGFSVNYGRNSNVENTILSEERRQRDTMMDDSEHGFVDTSHVNDIPIEAFSVPDTTPPVQAIPVLCAEFDGDDDNDDDDHRDAHEQQNVSSGTMNAKKSSKRKNKKNIVAFLFISLLAAAAITGLLVGILCGSGALTCRRSTSDVNIEEEDAGEVDERATMISSYINSMSFVPENDVSSDLNRSALKEAAVDWMIRNDPLQLNLTESPQDFFHLRQRYALAVLWFHTTIESTWFNQSGWLSDSHECNWYGIECIEIDHGNDIGIQNTVIGLNMSENNMNGIIPADLAFLSNLRLWKFDFNAISGTIPDSLGQCTNLERVELEFNYELTGSLPDSIGNWTSLTYFDISYSNFTGPFPSSLGNWWNIEYFDASSNRFYSTLPSEFGFWTTIHTFSISLNQMYGSLPESIGNWKLIEAFAIIADGFTGMIPSTLGNWNNIMQLAINDNEFTGSIPETFGNFDNLIYAWFDNNNLSGSMPEGLCAMNLTGLIANCDVCDCCTMCV